MRAFPLSGAWLPASPETFPVLSQGRPCVAVQAFLPNGEAKTGVLASDVVKQIKEWRSPYGNAYTLLQLKTTRE